MLLYRTVFIGIIVSMPLWIQAQHSIPANEVIETNRLLDFLKTDVKEKWTVGKPISEEELAKYFREKFSERYFYEWQIFSERFDEYNANFQKQSDHESRALDHMQKFADSTHWLLPFNYLNGEPVDAYALRHLARQHKMVDVAFQYFYDHKDPKYINYFVGQVNSLNAALHEGSYEKIEDGNGVYEVFRSGYRVLNWLRIHNMFLGEKAYTDKDQLVTIATLLQHGAHLYEQNANFQWGNHQTRGMSALAMLAILFRDFEGTHLWYQRAMDRLEEHLLKEINEDGFQFERSVHYHMSDIENYFYVYQLAQISDITVGEVWRERLYALFNTLALIAYPDKSAPVLQDDTDNPWAEKNDISGTMTLGYLLFKDSCFGYFAENQVDNDMYWFFKKEQLMQLQSITKKTPDYLSLSFPDTHYYIMREGWDKKDKMLVISAGLSNEKPDHQHGDMLGVQAMANGQVILPNYQVRYSLPDYEFFKNSMVKNVALVDDQLQGKAYTSNQGGSGFGKFKMLPKPQTIVWKSNPYFDLYVGSHDGFESDGVAYQRQVIYVKDDFWIVKDNFKSDSSHVYKQVWQGHYTHERGPNLIRSTFADASGCDIFQMNELTSFYSSGVRGKEWTVLTKKDLKDFNFISVIYPYAGFENRIDELDKSPTIKDWRLNQLSFQADGAHLQTLSKGPGSYLFGVEKVRINGLEIAFSVKSDVFLVEGDEFLYIHSIGCEEVNVIIVNLDGSEVQKWVYPGDVLELRK